MRNILAAVDLDNTEEKVIKKAAEFARSFGSKLWIIHVAAPDPDFVGYEPGPQSVRDNRAAEIREKHRSLQTYIKKLQEEGIDAEGLLLQGPTVETIMTKAEKLNAELLVIGYEDHSFLHKLFIGEFSSKIIDKSKIPLMVVPLQ